MIGAAMASKFTALWLFPVLGLLGPLPRIHRRAGPRKAVADEIQAGRQPVARLICIAGVFCAALTISLLVLLACYFVIRIPSYHGRVARGHETQPGRPSRLPSRAVSQHGWWYYFLVAFGVKSPPGTLALLVLAAAFVVPFDDCRHATGTDCEERLPAGADSSHRRHHRRLGRQYRLATCAAGVSFHLSFCGSAPPAGALRGRVEQGSGHSSLALRGLECSRSRPDLPIRSCLFQSLCRRPGKRGPDTSAIPT